MANQCRIDQFNLISHICSIYHSYILHGSNSVSSSTEAGVGSHSESQGTGSKSCGAAAAGDLSVTFGIARRKGVCVCAHFVSLLSNLHVSWCVSCSCTDSKCIRSVCGEWWRVFLFPKGHKLCFSAAGMSAFLKGVFRGAVSPVTYKGS